MMERASEAETQQTGVESGEREFFDDAGMQMRARVEALKNRAHRDRN